jgi:peptide/nickel transport system substrate-binding protein
MRVTGGLHFWNYPPDYDPKDHITEDIYVLPDWEKRVDEIFQLQASEVDAAKRWDLFAEYQMLFAEYQPMVYTITSNYLYAHKNELKLTHTPNTFVGILYNVEGIWKD